MGILSDCMLVVIHVLCLFSFCWCFSDVSRIYFVCVLFVAIVSIRWVVSTVCYDSVLLLFLCMVVCNYYDLFYQW